MKVEMNYLMLPAMLHISKYIWITFHLLFKILTLLYFNFFIKATYGTQCFGIPGMVQVP